MEQHIIDYIEKYNYTYVKIENEESLSVIYDLYKNNKISNIEYDDSMIYLYYGVYFNINNIYENGVTCYQIAIKKGNNIAPINLGLYYEKHENYYEARKYYKMGAINGNIYSMVYLAAYYNKTKKYDKMEDYCLRIINKDTNICNTDIIETLADYYYDIKKNYDQAVKYYLLIIKEGKEKGYMFSILGYYYYVVKINIKKAKQYLMMGLEKNDSCSIISLGYYYLNKKKIDKAIKYFTLIIKNGYNDSINDAMSIIFDYYDSNLNNKTINDAIITSHKLKQFNKKYAYIKMLFEEEYDVTNYYMLTEYYFASDIQKLIIKYKHKICNHKKIFYNCNNILLFLWCVKNNKNINKYIKIDIIYYIII